MCKWKTFEEMRKVRARKGNETELSGKEEIRHDWDFTFYRTFHI